MTLLAGLAYGASYSLLGILLLMLGFAALDAVTPGHLGRHLTDGEGSANAAVVVSAGFLGLGAVIFTAIWRNADAGFGSALGWTAAFGALGVLLQIVSFLVLDRLTPGSLRDLVVSPRLHPGSFVAGAAQLSVSAIVCASIA